MALRMHYDIYTIVIGSDEFLRWQVQHVKSLLDTVHDKYKSIEDLDKWLNERSCSLQCSSNRCETKIHRQLVKKHF